MPIFLLLLQTAALDFETDLKTRIIPSICANLSPEQLGKIKVSLLVLVHSWIFFMPSLIAPLWIEQGVVECPNPDNDIRRFDANMRLFPPTTDNEKCPLTISNTLLQSCYLRYSEWACGVAVYTGKDSM
jgi:phospholipid-translocating ATPase